MTLLEFVKSLNLAIVILFTLLYLYQGFYIVVGLVRRRWTDRYQPKKLHRFAAIVSARNEEAVIGELLESLRRQNYPQELLDLYVVADNCTDNTAATACQAGAFVYERFDQKHKGKGYAIDYLFRRLKEERKDVYDGYFVFDADNLVDPNFVSEMNRTFDRGYDAVTCYRNSKNFGSNWISAGYSIWFLREARFLNFPRTLLGTNCHVSGTGFLVSARVIEDNGGWPFHLLTEDIQFSVDCAIQGKKIGYLYTLEHDCIQLPYFLKVASACGLALLDADACGRSVPTVGNILTCVYGYPASPFVYASARGETVVIETQDPLDTQTVELIGRSIVVAYNNMLISYCMPPLTKDQCETCLVAGSPSSLQATGRALIAAKVAGADPVEAALGTFTGKLICRGTVVDRELVCRDGFDFGKTMVRDDETGEVFTLLVQNENLAVQNGAGKLVLTAPDSVAMLALERGEGITNDELRIGMPLAVLGIKAAEPWYRIPEGFSCWDEVFRNVGLGENVEHVAF